MTRQLCDKNYIMMKAQIIESIYKTGQFKMPAERIVWKENRFGDTHSKNTGYLGLYNFRNPADLVRVLCGGAIVTRTTQVVIEIR